MNRQMTAKDWVITFLVTCVPILNIVFLIIWACESETTCKFVTRRRYSIAALITMVIFFGLYMIIALCAVLFAAASTMQ